MRSIFGESGRLFVAPFYLSVGMIFSQVKKAKNMTFKSMIGIGITLTTGGFLIKLAENNVGGYSEIGLVLLAAGFISLACVWKKKFKQPESDKVSLSYKLRKFSSFCYFMHMMIYTLLCIFVWHEFKSGFGVFITVLICVVMLFVVKKAISSRGEL